MFEKSQSQSCPLLELGGAVPTHPLCFLGDDALGHVDLDAGLERCAFPAEDTATQSAMVSSFEGPKGYTTDVAL